MSALRRLILTLLCTVLAITDVMAGTVVLSSAQGALAGFTENSDGWTWTSLTPPRAAAPVLLDELGYQIASATGSDISPSPASWTLVEQASDRIVFEHDFPVVGIRLRRVFSFGPADNVLRIETWAKSLAGTNVLNRLSLVSAHFLGETFKETGIANQSFPLFGRRIFLGLEHVSGECHTWAEVGWAGQSPHLAIGPDWTFVVAAVVGWPVPGGDIAPGASPMRAAFIHYLDTVRLKPADLELHTNTWWTLPLPFSEADVLHDIRALKEGFHDRTGMFFDSYALDLGWSDRHSVWRVDAQRFPNGLDPIVSELAGLNCKLGLWLSPGSAYPDGLDNAWLAAQGYEMTPSTFGSTGAVACFALGNRYQAEVKDSIVGYARQYGLGHVKLDFMAHTCDVASHGHPTGLPDSCYAIDAGLADVLDSLRAVNPRMALEPLVCGTPPSPWWAMHTPYLLGPDGDDVPNGRVACPEWIESLITSRDIAYRADQEKWLMPTQALETFDIVVQTAGDFQNMAAMAIGRGRWFISTYLKPEYMRPADWDFLAGLVRWARENKAYLEDSQQFGGKPELKQAYGYVLHTAAKDIYCIRNPWIEWRTIQLPVAASVTATRDLRLLYPRRGLVARMTPNAAGPRITLAPYETMILETVGTDTTAKVTATPAIPKVTVAGATAVWSTAADGTSSEYAWNGTVTVPAVSAPELCVLVQGADAVKNSACQLVIDGEVVTAAKTTSSGQFAAASRAPVENWAWFRTPLTPGLHSVHVGVTVALTSASFGLYVRGTTTVPSDPVPATGSPFPVFHPTERAWSGTVAALKAYNRPLRGRL